tara:strand:- start:66 stop:839 length:774 start_codon:yes stop_codon:yes gene_type:complete
MHVVERYEYKGHSILVHHDPDPQNPRKDFDNAGTMICWHSRYNLGDIEKPPSQEEWRKQLAIEVDPTVEDRIDYWENGKGWSRVHGTHDPVALVDSKVEGIISKAIDDNVILLPLYLYDHSGITMSTGRFSCNWDSGQVGWIYITKEQALKEWGKARCTKKVVERAIKYLKGEVETYDTMLTGQVYGFRILKPATEAMVKAHEELEIDVDDDDREELSSCWGFFGSDNYQEDGYMVQECKGEIDHEVESQEQASQSV